METIGQPLHLKARDQYPLAATYWKNKMPKGIVVINSGTCIAQKRYFRFAHWLAQKNYDVLIYDYRGVGKSGPDNLKGFKASIVDWGQLDIPAVIDWMVEKYPTNKRYIIGHSMGGQIIGLADNINQIDKVITFVPSYGNWQNNAPKGRWKMGVLWATVFPLMALIVGYFPASRLNLGHDWPKGVTWDWWSWGIRRLPHYKIMDNKGIQHFYHHVKVPTKAYFTSDDHIASERSIPFYKTDFASTDLEVVILKPEDYGVEKIAHMGMFSPKCLRLWEEVVEDLKL